MNKIISLITDSILNLILFLILLASVTGVAVFMLISRDWRLASFFTNLAIATFIVLLIENLGKKIEIKVGERGG